MKKWFKLTFSCLAVAMILSLFADGSSAQINPVQVLGYDSQAQVGSGIVGGPLWRPDGQVIAVGNAQGEIRLYDSQFNYQQTLTLETEYGLGAAWSPNSQLLATSTDHVSIWETTGYTLQLALPPRSGPEEGYGRAPIWNPESTQIAYFNELSRAMEIYDVTTGQLLVSFTPTDLRTEGWAWRPGHNQIATTHEDVVRLWNSITGQLEHTFNISNRGGVHWSYSGDYMVVINYTEFTIVDMLNFSLTTTYQAPIETVAYITWNAQNLLAVAPFGGNIYIYDASTPTNLQLIAELSELTFSFRYVFPSWNNQSNQLAIGGNSGAAIWDATSNQIVAETFDYTGQVKWFDVNADGSRIAMVILGPNFRNNVEIWDVAANQFLYLIEPQHEAIETVAQHPTSDVIAFTEADGQSYIVDDLEDMIISPLGSIGQVMAWDTSGTYLLASDDGVITVLHSATGATTVFNGVAFQNSWHPSQLLVLGIDEYGGGTVWDVTSGEMIVRLPASGVLTWSNDGSEIFSSGRSTVTVWDATTGSQLRELSVGLPAGWLGHNVAGHLITTSRNNMVELFDATDGTSLGTLPLQPQGIMQLEVIADGTIFAVSRDNVVQYFEPITMQPDTPSFLRVYATFTPTGTTAGFVLDDENPQDEGLEEDGFEVEWRGGWQGTFSEWTPYTTLPANPGTGSVAFELAQPIACEYGIIQVRVRAFYDTQPRLHSEWSNTAEVNLPCDDPTLPSPSNLVIDGANALPVVITWTDNASDEQGHRIERSVDGGAFTEIGTQGPDSTTYTDFTAICGVNYAYRVRVERDGFVSIPSNVVSVSVGCNAAYWQAYPSGAATGPTNARAGCAINRSYVQASLVIEDPYAQHEISIAFSTSTDVYLSDHFTFLPNTANPGEAYPLKIYYHNYPTTTIPEYPLDAAAGSPLPSSGATVISQLRNLDTGACTTMVAEYYCQSGTATIISNEPTCVFE